MTESYCTLSIEKCLLLVPVYFHLSELHAAARKQLTLCIHIENINLHSTILHDTIYTNKGEGMDYSLIVKELQEYSNVLATCVFISEFLHRILRILEEHIPTSMRTESSRIRLRCILEKPILHAEQVGVDLQYDIGLRVLESPSISCIWTISEIPALVLIGLKDWELSTKQQVLLGLKWASSSLPKSPFLLQEWILHIKDHVENRARPCKTLEASGFQLRQYALPYLISEAAKADCSLIPKEITMSKPYAICLAKRVSLTWTCPAMPVHMDNRVHQVYLALGSNMGDRTANIAKALNLLQTSSDSSGSVCVKSTSRIYLSKPMYYIEQGDFLNACCHIETDMQPEALLQFTQKIQQELSGQVTKSILKGPRIIDLDILYYDNIRVQSPHLQIPHPGISERLFVLRPLLDLPGMHACPYTGTPLQDLIDSMGCEYVENYAYAVIPFRHGTRLFAYERETLLMGIQNMTPDSFSGDGLLNPDKAIETLERWTHLYSSGGDTTRFFIFDIGGASSRPGADHVSEEEEWNRVAPLLSAIKASRKFDIIRQHSMISIDTSHPYVANLAIQTGLVDMLNDSSGNGNLIELACKYDIPIVLMHTKGTSKTMMGMTNSYPHADCTVSGLFAQDIVQEINDGILKRALIAGILPWHIILDPGIGFAKNSNQDLALLRQFCRSSIASKYPTMIGASRKKFIKACDAESGQDIPGSWEFHPRMMATAAACTASIAQGVAIVRIHDLDMLKAVCRLSDCIYKTKHHAIR